MECVSHPTFTLSPFLASPINLRPSIPGRDSTGRLRASIDGHKIKPKIRQRRSKEWWRWVEDIPDLNNPTCDSDWGSVDDDDDDDLPYDKDWDLIRGANRDFKKRDLKSRDEEEEMELVEEFVVKEEEEMAGEDGGREASDYDRRAQIFDKSSKVFRALKEKSDNGA